MGMVFIHIGLIEQAELELLLQMAAHSRVDEAQRLGQRRVARQRAVKVWVRERHAPALEVRVGARDHASRGQRKARREPVGRDPRGVERGHDRERHMLWLMEA